MILFCLKICIYQNFSVLLRRKRKIERDMAINVINTIEYIVILVADFAMNNGMSEEDAYRYLNNYGAIALCEKHYGIMHTLSVEDNVQTLREYCRRKGGTI